MTTLLFPGQGSQAKGMGADLFGSYPAQVAIADRVMGRSIVALCRDDPSGDLRKTQFTQPALYVVGALAFLNWRAQASRDPDWLAGHSLGELTALFAGGAFDFETGLSLVVRRGALMAALGEGGMSAVIGLDEAVVERVLREFPTLDIANINTPSQIVLAGPPADLKSAEAALVAAGARACIPLNVSGAFHSRAMRGAQSEFARALAAADVRDPKIPVVSNVTARPHASGAVRANLAAQLCSPVRWSEQVRWIWGQGEDRFVEMAPGSVLAGLVQKVRSESQPLPVEPRRVTSPTPSPKPAPPPTVILSAAPSVDRARSAFVAPPQPGNAAFRARFGVDQAVVIGGMGHGVGSVALVQKLASAGFLAFLGADGLSDAELRSSLTELRSRLGNRPFGVNVRGRAGDGAAADARLRLLTEQRVGSIEVGGFHQVSRSLVRYRLTRLTRGPDGSVRPANRLVAKVTRPETAEAFLSPPPPALVAALLAAGEIEHEAATLAPRVPMADAVVALGDCGGDTDSGTLLALLPLVLRLRDRLAANVAVGAGGGIGTPAAAAAAFLIGADFVQVGSVMQCTPEAGISDQAKDMLAKMSVQDTELAPSEDWFDWGGKVRVLKRGSLFAARASKLYDLYRFHERWDLVPAAERQRIEQNYLGAPFDDILASVRAEQPSVAAVSGREQMALVFRRYLADARRRAIAGSTERSADLQIWTGPALGAFNDWVRGTALEDWRRRDAVSVARLLAEQTQDQIRQALARSDDTQVQPAVGRSRNAMMP